MPAGTEVPTGEVAWPESLTPNRQWSIRMGLGQFPIMSYDVEFAGEFESS